MGSAMAKHLLTEGFSLAVFDIDKSKSSALALNSNCLIAETPAEVMKVSSRLIIMLPNSDQVDKMCILGNLQEVKMPKFHKYQLTFFCPIYHKAKLEVFYPVNAAR